LAAILDFDLHSPANLNRLSKSMKIVSVHNTHQHRGGEDVVFEQEKRMLERAGHTVVAYHRTNHEIGAFLGIIGQLDLAKRTIWASDSLTQFDALLASENPDVVHIHNTFIVISPSIYSACRKRGIPIVQTLHNFRFLCAPSNLFRDGKVCEECIDHSLLRAVQHKCYRGSASASAVVATMLGFHRMLGTLEKSIDRYIALTDFSRGKFISAGYPADKISVKPNFLESDPGVRQQAGDFALYIGRFSPDKGVPTLIDAWSKVPKYFQLQILGDGRERADLEAQARRQNLTNITFRGFLSRENTLSTLKSARFLVMPSLWYETFGLVIVEAFACGVPVICSQLGAMAEIVHDGVDGLHFNPGDATDLAEKVKWAWKNPAALESMGRAARAEFENRYTSDKNYPALIEVYEQAIRAHGDSRALPVRRKAIQLSGRADVV
jgi:glycosyltransferase involved in cell wall biosynthesis